MTAPLPLIRLSQLHPFVRIVDDLGAQSETLLRAANLPVYGLCDRPESFVSELSLWAFLDHAEASFGSRETGWEIGIRSAVEDIGDFGADIMGSSTLGVALQKLCADVGTHSSHACFGLAGSGRDVWFWRRGVKGIDVGCRAVEQYVVAFILQIVRRAAGPDWSPSAIRIQDTEALWAESCESLANVPIACGSRDTAILIPRLLLPLPMETARAGSSSPAGERLTPAPDFLNSLQQCLAPLVGEVPLTVDLGAEISGTSVRSLQRLLAAGGTTWSEVVDGLRFERARELLGEADNRVIDVAHSLGYSDAAHFTRAFRRWTGAPPLEYRQAQARDAARPGPV